MKIKSNFVLWVVAIILFGDITACNANKPATRISVQPTSSPSQSVTILPTSTHGQTNTFGQTSTITQTPTITRRATRTTTITQTPRPTHTKTLTSTRRPTATLKPTKTRWSTATHAPAFISQSKPVFIGTSLPSTPTDINSNNYPNLSYVAQWSRGNILGAAFTPDGKTFVVGSIYGLSIYDSSHPEDTPDWLSFSQPFFFESIFFSVDRKYMLLENRNSSQIRNYPDGQIIDFDPGITWLRTSSRTEWQESLPSLDGTKIFKFYSTHSEENWNHEISNREMNNAVSGELLYKLPDETTYVEYKDYNSPLGCDLYSFSMCGNVYDPSAQTPYRIAFSPSGDTLTILYRARNLWNSHWFSTLRIYNLETGELLTNIGSFKKPIETFAYSPDGNILVIGYVNGIIQLWDIQRKEDIFNSWQYSTYIEYLSYSKDGKYLLIQRPNVLEVRRTKDGSLRSSFESVAFAVSPTDDILAVADSENNILIQKIDEGKTFHKFHAHDGKIYSLAFSPDGQRLVSSGEDCGIRAWDVKTGQFIHFYEKTVVNPYGERFTESRIFIKHLRFIQGTNQLIGFGSWATVVNWNTDSGATNYVIESAPLEFYQGMKTLNPHFPESFGVDLANNRFFIGGQGYDLSNGSSLGEYQAPTNLEPGCYPGGPLSSDGKLLFTRGYDGREGHICILDPNDLHLLLNFEVIPDSANDYDSIDWLYLSPNGSQLIVSTYSGVIHVYQVNP